MNGIAIRARAASRVRNLACLFVAATCVVACWYSSVHAAEATLHMQSPDGHIKVEVQLDTNGSPHYSIVSDGKVVLEPSQLGLIRDDANFASGLSLTSVSASERIEDRYELLTSKRRHNHYIANRQVFHFEDPSGKKLDVIFQVSNDGVAFRYVFPETSPQVRKVTREATSFRFASQTRAWLQPIAAAKTGFGETNPSYEEIYEKDVAVGTASPTGAGWVYPALFRTDDTWLLVSESALARNYAGTRLKSTWRNPEYTIGFPDPLEGVLGGPVTPQSTLPWIMPWRVIAIGSLKTIVESTLGTDVADNPQPGVTRGPHGPGKASWSWPLLGDDKTDYATSKRFIDYAAAMGWRYTLIDALWDKQIGYAKVKELIDYARTKNVAILLWYNSAGDWNTAPQTPRNVMLTRESRIREFNRLRDMGVAGLKVDFFPGDGQSSIEYYHDILADAAAYGFLMNFHGSTLPRGWQRTYPNLMTMEAVRGMEFVTFEQGNAEDQPTHAAMLPFTRNVFDPMDFTPVVLDRINNIERRTMSAFELALSVLFTSGIQHYAEIPEGMAKAPLYVREFLKQVPSVWDDVRFIDGFPGKYVVIARRAEKRWYIVGINGEREAKTL
ncbi:MAG TPA: glycoside hydrolase family 97 catalytic domain-containing protein, partial [Steroidobacteraceae bacterium]|nr:glycoside hydrolase family 97 catalytic domain-containing protein [Steroidobacteraceae bacterium]